MGDAATIDETTEPSAGGRCSDEKLSVCCATYEWWSESEATDEDCAEVHTMN